MSNASETAAALPRIGEGRLIYDVGAHRGEDTAFYLSLGFSVVAIEAMPALCEPLSDRFAREIAEGRLTLLNLAISKQRGPLSFFANEKSDWGTCVPEWAARNERLGTVSRCVTVQGECFEEILRTHGVPYYLKVDIEGCDLLCLEALKSFSERPKFLSIESNKTEFGGLMAEFALLKSLGYSKFKVVNQSHVPRQVAPIEHVFQPGSSGLFGDDLPGRWLSAGEAIASYVPIFARYKLFGDNTAGARLVRRAAPVLPPALRLLSPWYDTHAAQ